MSDVPGGETAAKGAKGASAAIKHVPKWAWIASAGVVGGVVFLKMKNNQGSTAPAASGDATPLADAPLTSVGLGPTQGAVGASDSGAGFVTGSEPTQIGFSPTDVIDLITALPGFAGGGGTPSSGATGAAPATSDAAPVAPAPVVDSPPPVAAAPAPPPAVAAPAFKVEYENRTRDNGKSGAARRVWCNRVTIHRYPDGHGVVVSEDKIRDGAC